MGWLGDVRKRLKKGIGRRIDFHKKGAKSVGRTAAPYIAKAAPYITGGAAAIASFLATPAAGAAVTALGGTMGRYWGATAARADGLSGHAAREEGRDVRKKAVIGGLIGTGAGTLTALATGSPWVSGVFSSSAAPSSGATVAKGSGAIQGGQIGASAGGGVGVGAGAGSGAGIGASVGSSVGVSSAPAAAGGGWWGAVGKTINQAGDLAAKTAAEAAAKATGKGVLETIGGAVGDVLGVAGDAAKLAAPFLPGLIPQKTPSDLGELLDFAAGMAGGGAPGAPAEDLSSAMVGREGIPGWMIAAGGAAALAVGYVAARAMKKKAA